MRNCGRELGVGERYLILKKFVKKLWLSGYSANRIQDIVESGLLGYYRMVQKEEQDRVRVNKPAKDGQEARDRRKVMGKATWMMPKSKPKEMVEEASCKGDQGGLRTAYQPPPPTSTSQPADQPTKPMMRMKKKVLRKKKKKPKAKQDPKPSFEPPPNQRLITFFTFAKGQEGSPEEDHGVYKELLQYEALED